MTTQSERTPASGLTLTGLSTSTGTCAQTVTEARRWSPCGWAISSEQATGWESFQLWCRGCVTHLVPWLAGGHARLPLVADTDLGEAFALAATADGLADYESFNICGPDFPTAREVIDFVADRAGVPRPRYSVPYRIGLRFPPDRRGISYKE